MRWAERDKFHARYALMPPARLKWYLQQLHLHQKISGDELAYWLAVFKVDPSL